MHEATRSVQPSMEGIAHTQVSTHIKIMYSLVLKGQGHLPQTQFSIHKHAAKAACYVRNWLTSSGTRDG